MPTQLITNEQLYEKVIKTVIKAKSFVWIGTADIKDMHIKYRGQTMSFLGVLDMLIKRGITVRLLHAKNPGENFRRSFDRYPSLWSHLERRMCPRVHFKHIIIDGKFVYTGSANLTGAGLGMKSPNRRNFEMGLISTEQQFIEPVMAQFNDVWTGKYCKSCGRRQFCPDPIA